MIRSNFFHLRLNRAEMSALIALGQEWGCSLSEALRTCLKMVQHFPIAVVSRKRGKVTIIGEKC